MSADPTTRETDIPDTLQSLLVAFTLALAFRGFVIEGFVIPTGSMAPQLMGNHVRYRSEATGYEYAFDGSESLLVRGVRNNGEVIWRYEAVPLLDPMLSQSHPISAEPPRTILGETRMGDRVLVLKYLYEFFDPERWDVVVFKNPVDPIGPSQNYIKRLVGVAGEQILLADGNVFVSEPGEPVSAMRIVRKPDHVQETVWQPVYNSDYIPGTPEARRWSEDTGSTGGPFTARNIEVADSRVWRSDGGGSLEWSNQLVRLDDFNAYNFLRYPLRGVGTRAALQLRNIQSMSDLRIAAALEVASPETFETELIIAALNHRFVFGIGAGEVSVALQSNDGANIDRATAAFSPTGAFEFECIHVDQKLQLRVDGELLVELKYEWSPVERLENAYRAFNLDRYIADASSQSMRAVALKWSFEASPLAMRRVRVDRDLYYKPGRLAPLQQAAANGETIEGPLFATNPKEPAVLGDDHYLMLGDNSSFSRDGRYWGRPHPLVVSTIGDDTPFVAHRDLLVGKAWCVYFPAPGRLSPGGPAVVPDFGRLRFIR
jgi:signal peptidase I